jgi:hypothetical protein
MKKIRIRDGKICGSGITIPDPQHCSPGTSGKEDGGGFFLLDLLRLPGTFEMTEVCITVSSLFLGAEIILVLFYCKAVLNLHLPRPQKNEPVLRIHDILGVDPDPRIHASY